MLDITVVVLTYNEEKHISRCIKSLDKICNRIVVVDSFSTDKTVEICRNLGADVYQNKWVNYATQFQWGLDNCDIDSRWTMRMDSDEYLEASLITELIEKLPSIEKDINGVYLKRKVFFKGKWIRYGGFYPHVLLRIWKTGEGRIEQRWMDEHIVIKNPKTCILKNDLVDDNLNNIGWWIDKHNSYSTREMIDLLNLEYNFLDTDDALKDTDDPQAKIKRIIKEKIYSNLPLGVRPILYFFYRYFLKLGFLDGKKGFLFHFLQGFWYRLIVDIKCNEVKRSLHKKQLCKQQVKKVVAELSNMDLD